MYIRPPPGSSRRAVPVPVRPSHLVLALNRKSLPFLSLCIISLLAIFWWNHFPPDLGHIPSLPLTSLYLSQTTFPYLQHLSCLYYLVDAATGSGPLSALSRRSPLSDQMINNVADSDRIVRGNGGRVVASKDTR